MAQSSPVKLGLIGVGHLGKIHANCLAAAAGDFTVAGVFDLDSASAKTVAAKHGWQHVERVEELFARCDAVDIVTPTNTHFVLAKAALDAGCHVFLEKPVTTTVAEADELEMLAAAKNLLIQVGHVERFNPAFQAVADNALRPVFIEAHRLAQFNPRSTDVSVVLDLMIHDLDIVLTLMPADIERVSASGVGVVGDSIDIANARIDFTDGSTANLTASRISLKAMRKLRLFQRDAYIGIDMLEKKTEVVQLSQHDPEHPGPLQLPTEDGIREVTLDYPEIQPTNAIQKELEEFVEAIQGGRQVQVDIRAAKKALSLAHDILTDIEERKSRLTKSLTLPQV